MTSGNLDAGARNWGREDKEGVFLAKLELKKKKRHRYLNNNNTARLERKEELVEDIRLEEEPFKGWQMESKR